jgi:hypothetical protein
MRRVYRRALCKPLLGRATQLTSARSLGLLVTNRYQSNALDSLAKQITMEPDVTGHSKELINGLQSNNLGDLANTVKEMEETLEKMRTTPIFEPTKDYKYLLDLLKKEYKAPTTPLACNVRGFLSKYGETLAEYSGKKADENRYLTGELLIRLESETDAAKRVEIYRSLPQLTDAAKAAALTKDLASASTPQEKEKIIKDSLDWQQNERKAAELKKRHPEFKEMHFVLDQFPPFAALLGEPSEPVRKATELFLNGRDPAAVNPADVIYAIMRKEGVDRLSNDQQLLEQASTELAKDSRNRLVNAAQQSFTRNVEQISEVLGEYRSWLQKKYEWTNEQFRQELALSEQALQTDVDVLLEEHPAWAAKIEEDINNHRWDVSVSEKEYQHEVKHYMETVGTHA